MRRKTKLTEKEKGERDEKLKSLGAYIQQKRKKLGLTLQDMALETGLTANFISLVERGEKSPSDDTLKRISYCIKENEDDLYRLLGIVPLYVRESLEQHEHFREMVQDIVKTVPPEKRDELLSEVQTVYQEFLRRHGINKD